MISTLLAYRPIRAVGLAALGGLALTSSAMAPAFATPGSGFTPNLLSSGTMGKTNEHGGKAGIWNLTMATNGQSTVGVDQLTVAPSGYSGWHSHAGIVVITVQTGSLRWTDGENCSTVTYNAGDTFVEPANHVHYVANPSSSSSATYTGVQIRPLNSPGRVDEVAPYNNCGL